MRAFVTRPTTYHKNNLPREFLVALVSRSQHHCSVLFLPASHSRGEQQDSIRLDREGIVKRGGYAQVVNRNYKTDLFEL